MPGIRFLTLHTLLYRYIPGIYVIRYPRRFCVTILQQCNTKFMRGAQDFGRSPSEEPPAPGCGVPGRDQGAGRGARTLSPAERHHHSLLA